MGSLSDKDSKIAGIDCGADDFITKPVDSIELRARVKSLLRIKFLYDEVMAKNVELQNTLRQLKDTQQKLIIHEKMASLGNLVAGVAHEINTPLGAMISNNDTFIRSVNKMKLLLCVYHIYLYVYQNIKETLDKVIKYIKLNNTYDENICAEFKCDYWNINVFKNICTICYNTRNVLPYDI